MSKHDHFTPMGVILLSILSLMPGMPAPNAGDERRCAPVIGQLVSVQGRVEVRSAGEARWQVGALNDALCGGDTIRTLPRSRTTLFLPAQRTTLQLDQSTTITLPDTAPSAAPFWLDLLEGAGHFLSRTPQAFKIKTPFINSFIEGTEFVVRVEGEQTLISVLNGTVLASNDAGSLKLQSGQAAIAKAHQAPLPVLIARPWDAVQWALYYPPIIDYRSAVAESAPAVQAALDLYRQGRLLDAFARLDRVPPSLRDGRYLDIRAGLLLSVGRVDEARADIEQVLRLHPGDGTAIALQSLIAVVQNDKDQALSLAKQAVSAEPRSPVPQIALSYAYQARFDIEKAFGSTQEATRLAPDNALAWARLSELSLSKGELDEALAAAKKAAVLEPALARTQTVLGFADLTEINIDDAKAAFTKAIALDPADPLPRLGLGLAQIRKGDLDKGTQDIEIAATLDPNNSLVRSYLGKAYYEQKRSGLAGTELQIAKTLDPKDPTPWFYDAIRKHSVNRPVEALQDLQEAIKLNDNRGVYRSKQLLDEDLAARGAALGRIYREVGFEQLALVEGWKSLNDDPTNYTAHRLLTDSYSVLPRHEIARVSELLQSQLLQPTNITPVQPQLAESDLFLLGGFGPAEPSLNEFNALFQRNRFSFLASGLAGSQDTYGDEVVHSGLLDSLSYSLGQFHYETNGFRPNNDINTDIYNAFAQLSLFTGSSIQFEARHQETDSGDLRSIFNPNFIFDGGFSSQGIARPIRRVSIERDTVRAGFHGKLAPSAHLIGSYIYRDFVENLVNGDATGNVMFTTEAQSHSGELQYLQGLDSTTVIVGAGHSEDNAVSHQLITFFPNTQIPSGPVDLGTSHTNAYAYGTVNVFSNLSSTLGLAFDSFDRADLTREYVSPKVGVIWQPLPATTLRAAWFKTLKRPFAAGQTIEPTHVAGFNQFFDDINGSRTMRYGAAWDQRFGVGLYGGIELTWRELDIPIVSQQGEHAHQREQAHRAYFNWTPSDRLIVSADYLYEKFNRRLIPLSNPEEPIRIVTHRVPITLGYFDPKGPFAKVKITYMNQHVELNSPVDESSGTEDFWVTDLIIGYRFPNRYGLASFGIKNLFDKKFRFQDSNFNTGEPLTPLFVPDRIIFGQITLAF